MLYKYLTLITVLYCSAICCSAQTCGTDEMHQYLMGTDEVYTERVAKEAMLWEKYATNKDRAMSKKIVVAPNDTIYEIPVVIHVLHTGGAVGTKHNPHDTVLFNLIDYVNKAYEAQWANYPDTNNGGTRVPIRLTLAKRDQNCKSFNGINRVDGRKLRNYEQHGVAFTNASLGVPATALSDLVYWSSREYYNLYIVHEIEDSTKWTGFAYYPSAGVNIAVIESRVAKAGKMTLVHEMGHAFGLRHTFEGDLNGTSCPANGNCLIDGDGICDTEPHKRSFTACGNEMNPCTNQSMNNTGSNFMSYSKGCRNKFTAEQRDKMVFIARHNKSMSSLVASDFVLNPTITEANCVSDMSSFNVAVNYNTGFNYVKFKSIRHSSLPHTYNNKLLYGDYSCRKSTELFTGRAYPIEIDISTSISIGQNFSVFIDYNDDGVFQVPRELVASGVGIGNKYKDTVIVATSGVTLCKYVRMRIVSDIITAPVPGSCSNLRYGQVKDYSVLIKPDPLTNITITQTTGTNPICPGAPLGLTASVVNGPTNYQLLWQINNSKVIVGTQNFVYTTHVNNERTFATILSKNLACDVLDTTISNIITVRHKSQNPQPIISKNNDTIVSDRYPVDWYLDGVGLLVPNSYSGYEPTVEGIYYAYNVDTTGCPSIRSNNLYSFPLGVSEQTPVLSKIFPNPAKSYFDIIVNNKKALIETVSVSNNMGQVVHSFRDVGMAYRVDTQQWQTGIYTITITFSNGIQERNKIVIVK